MSRTINWNILAAAAATAGMSFFGVSTAQAAPLPTGVAGTSEDCATDVSPDMVWLDAD